MRAGPYALWAAVCALGAAGFLLGLVFVVGGGEPTRFMLLGHAFYDREGVAELVAPARPRVEREFGFDGQFFFYLAFDPLLRGDAVERALDSPHLRARRIGFPWLSRLLAPRAAWIPFGMTLAQIVAAGWLLAVLAALARAGGAPPAALLPVVTSLWLLLPLTFFTSELLASALVATALWLHARARPAALLAAGAACLTKGVCALLPLALAAHALGRRRWREAGLWLLALLPLVAWSGYLTAVLAAEPRPADSFQNLTLPFAGAAEAAAAGWRSLASGSDPRPGMRTLTLVASAWHLAAALVGLVLFARRPGGPALFVAAAALLALCLSGDARSMAYREINNFARQLFLLPLGLTTTYLAGAGALRPGERRALLACLLSAGGLGAAWLLLRIVEGSPL